jgi:5-methylcytosine-specific restriction endonuclease McrA
MALRYAVNFYNSVEWRKCQAAFMQSRNYICERCGRLASIAHHKKYITPSNISDPSITLNWDNLMAVCLDCHNAIHGKGGPCVEGLEFDAEGNLIQSPRSAPKG